MTENTANITRPAVSEKRLSLTAHSKVRYELKTPYRDGTTHVSFPDRLLRARSGRLCVILATDSITPVSGRTIP